MPPLPLTIDNMDPALVWAGVDEVGRGSLWGDVVAAAVVYPSDFLSTIDASHPDYADLQLIRDSKRLSARRRERLVPVIKRLAAGWAVAAVDSATIDDINIYQATLRAMHGALDGLVAQDVRFDRVVVDGSNFKPYLRHGHGFVPFACVEGGDDRLLSIASASILAKVARDESVERASREDPSLANYDLAKNKGYGTAKHMRAIQEHGVSPQHRLSFAPCARVASMVAAEVQSCVEEGNAVA
jgi:ribonuclease HII